MAQTQPTDATGEPQFNEDADLIGTTITNTATASGLNADQVQATDSTRIVASELTITKTGGPNRAVPGQVVTYIINVENADPDGFRVVNPQMTEHIPADFTLFGVNAFGDQADDWTCQAPANAQVTCTARSLYPGDRNKANFICLPKSNTNMPFAITNNNQGVKTHTSSSCGSLRNTINANN